jgi:hypothetical protein
MFIKCRNVFYGSNLLLFMYIGPYVLFSHSFIKFMLFFYKPNIKFQLMSNELNLVVNIVESFSFSFLNVCQMMNLFSKMAKSKCFLGFLLPNSNFF